MDPNDRQDSLLAAPPRVVNVGLELFAVELLADLAGHADAGAGRSADGGRPEGAGARVVHVQWSPPAGGNAHLASLLGKLRS
jgi:hypothetical protein